MDMLRSALRFRLVRFVTVGVGAAALLFALSYLFVRLGMSPFTGSIAAYAIAFAVAYTCQHGWTFGGKHDHSHALPRYLAVQLGCALISGLVAHVAVERFGASPLAMSIAVTVVASAASYVLSTVWVFPSRADRR
ncbi:GtrA family protein [Mesorhizobium yinganensis]|uniref:GtrA family protein n=1 Tax=Mesorhizobium yinganensis TaxID=3157707 RepID=UPI0032B82A52